MEHQGFGSQGIHKLQETSPTLCPASKLSRNAPKSRNSHPNLLSSRALSWDRASSSHILSFAAPVTVGGPGTAGSHPLVDVLSGMPWNSPQASVTHPNLGLFLRAASSAPGSEHPWHIQPGIFPLLTGKSPGALQGKNSYPGMARRTQK